MFLNALYHKTRKVVVLTLVTNLEPVQNSCGVGQVIHLRVIRIPLRTREAIQFRHFLCDAKTYTDRLLDLCIACGTVR